MGKTGTVMIENSLIAALPRKDCQRLLDGLDPVTLIFGDVLYEPGDTIDHVYFPGSSLVSLLTLVDGHLALEVGLIGREGMVGIPLILGHKTSAVRALVQGGGAGTAHEGDALSQGISGGRFLAAGVVRLRS